jgi:hypothetical protein
MAAAAVIVVLGGGGYGIALLATQGGGHSTVAGGRAQPRPRVGSPVMGPYHAASGPAAFVPVSSGTDYTAGRFGSQVRAALARFPSGSGARRPAVGEQGQSSTALSGCVTAVTGGERARLVDLARYQGRAAIIIVVSARAPAPARAWAVGRDCSAVRPDVMAQIPVAGAG